MEFKFNHQKKSLAEAIGVTKEELDEFSDKFHAFANKIVKEKTKETSKIMENVMNTFSYSDLVIAATLYVENCIIQAAEKKKNKS